MNPVRESVATETFGPYEVYERLGMGGMASVHRAKKRGPAGFERTVALKRMLSHLTEDRGFVESFVREAKVASLLVHPNIAQVYDFGRIGGVFYIAMEMVAGFDLRKLLRHAHKTGEAIPLGVILTILAELCDALDYAHSFVDEAGQHLNIVHRDISPSNMIIAHTGHVKVIDFGIAKASSRQLKTETGMVKGKLGYMAPEAAMGMSVSAQSDMFSVGVTAWELVTALPLFSARTDFETMRKLREETVAPPSQHNPACPPRLDRLILSALAREPEQRITSARAFRLEIDAIAQELQVQLSARAVADWIKRLADNDSTGRAASSPTGPVSPADLAAAARARTPSGRQLPLPAPEVTAVERRSKPTRPPTQLRRDEDDAALATEIWGEDNGTQQSGEPAHDFSMMDSGSVPPLPGHDPRVMTAPNLSALPALSGGHPHFTPAYSPAQQLAATGPQMAPHLGTQNFPPGYAPAPAAAPKSKLPLLILAMLAVLAGILGAILYMKKADNPPVQARREVGLEFNIEPKDAIIEVAGKPVEHKTSVLPGVYSITVHKDGYKPWSTSLGVRDGEDQTINIVLEKETPVVATTNEPPNNPDLEDPFKDKTPDPKTPDTSTKTHGKHTKTGHQTSNETKAEEEAAKQEAAKQEAAKQEAAKQEAAKQLAAKQEALAKEEAAKQEAAKQAAAKQAELDAKPKTTPVVAATAVTKVSGEVPQLQGNGEGSGDVLAKMCIDESGRVTSATIKKSPPELASDLQRALMGWRYKPYMKGDKASAVCFPLQFRVVLKP
jgi:serine/threonine protein kinase